MFRTGLLLLMLAGGATQAAAETALTVTHGPTPDPVYLDLGEAGESVGDQRIFRFDGIDSGGAAVRMYFVLTNAALAETADEFDARLTTAVFSLDGGTLLVSGIGFYPPQGSTLKVDATLERAVVGGTGKFAGARGSVISTHLPDGTWAHEFHLQ